MLDAPTGFTVPGSGERRNPMTNQDNYEDIEEIEDNIEDISSLEDSPTPEDLENSFFQAEPLAPGTPLYRLRLDYANENFIAGYRGDPLSPGDKVMVVTPYGRDLAQVCGPLNCRCGQSSFNTGATVPWIDRLAEPEELDRENRNREQEKGAFQLCREKIEAHGLEMKLVLVHIMVGEAKIWFFYTAENRVDFRELVKDLVSIFKIRIQMHQIGVRDEAQVVGGLGVCGRCYCCHAAAGKLKPVSIKMVKDQNLSLNSMKISGPCGRLLCCLAYEHSFYSEQRRQVPLEGTRLSFDGTQWKVTELNMILGKLKLAGEDGRVLSFPASAFEKIDGHWRLAKPMETALLGAGGNS
jgi:cell fate regulator YaaT (PSP1 superfamily)